MTTYESDAFMFRVLSADEEAEFVLYAIEHDPPAGASWRLYHPVCRRTWLARGIQPPTEPEAEA